METSSKEIFERHRFILMRIRNRICTRRSDISFRKITSKTIQRGNAGLSNPRLPKIIADASKSNLSPNLHTIAIVGGSFVIVGASGSIPLVRPSTLLRSDFCRNDCLLASLRFFQLLGRDLPMLRGSFEHLIESHQIKLRRNRGSVWACSELDAKHAQAKSMHNERSSQAKAESESGSSRKM
jgi:hypothetical protein